MFEYDNGIVLGIYFEASTSVPIHQFSVHCLQVPLHLHE